MKKVFALFVSMMLLVCAAYAESDTDYEALLAEKDAQIVALQAEIDELRAQIEQLAATPEPVVATYETLQKGSSGQGVADLQQRLKELGYLSGTADGSYGSQTASAVSDFQASAGLEPTGIADEATQEALYADHAPKSAAAEYEDLDYTANARDPEAYTGTKIKFSGKIVQVMEDDEYAVFRIATKGSYDDVVYAIYVKPADYKRFLEDDKVQVYGISTGIYTYTSVMGGDITIPSLLIEKIVLK